MMTDAEISGFMNWRGPGAYTQWQLARVRRIVEEVQRREREACANVCEQESMNWPPSRDFTLCAAAIRARGHDAS
jgi:hypothetical protein